MNARASLSALGLLLLLAPGCSTTPVIVPVRSMERPKDAAFLCLEITSDGSPRGAPIEKCRANALGQPVDVAGKAVDGTDRFHLHAVVTQIARGELAVVDLGRVPDDTSDGLGLIKADPRTPGYNFLPVSEAPTAVVADPDGKAVYVASGHTPRIDIIPAELLRGPIDTNWYDTTLPWPHLDFDPLTEGKPGYLAIEREGGKNDRLYVVLPDTNQIAVFDLSASALAPTRVGTLRPTLAAASPLPVAPRVCLDAKGAPRACLQCVDGDGNPKTCASGDKTREVPCGAGESTPTWWDTLQTSSSVAGACLVDTGFRSPAATFVSSKTPTSFHLGPATLAAGKLFVADDAAPYVHVFDVADGAGVEVARLDVGSATAQVAVSPIVPDEVTWDNADAIEVCETRGWVGDGLDHTADSRRVADKLGGRCRAHRYVYAIDRKNSDDGDGTIAVVDLPVVKRKDGGDDIDLAGATLAQPFACDAPSFPAKRIPLAGFGIGNNLPVKAITFVSHDPPTSTSIGGGLTGVRCRPDRTADGRARPVNEELDKVTYPLRVDAAQSWNSAFGNGSVRFLRGTFALAVLASGAVFPLVVDDYDSLCRGAAPDASNVLAEIDFANIVRRHHPRPARIYNRDNQLAPSPPTPSRIAASLTVSTADLPKLTVLGPTPEGAKGKEQKVDSLFALSGEDWVLTYEGEIPGFATTVKTVGTFLQEGADWVLLDPGAGICRKGAEADGASNTNDYLQILDDPCTLAGQCDAAQVAECGTAFGVKDDIELRGPASRRDVPVKRLTDDRFVLDVDDAPPAAGSARRPLTSAAAARLKRCYPGLTHYTVRAHNVWTIVGDASGFLHRRVVDDKSADKSCKVDTTKPSIVQGRVPELAKAPESSDPCAVFFNPQVGLYMVKGNVVTPRDMTFRFSNKQAFASLSISVGSLPTTVLPLSSYRKGVDVLGWYAFATVDANDRGLQLFSLASDLSAALRTAN
ncbi:MAG: hypothetical protein JNL79_34410 [Myxococcales bacterium]|nr:hypothetical protein [Myxococcales bacterium]